jgi:hypothetical protein
MTGRLPKEPDDNSAWKCGSLTDESRLYALGDGKSLHRLVT